MKPNEKKKRVLRRTFSGVFLGAAVISAVPAAQLVKPLHASSVEEEDDGYNFGTNEPRTVSYYGDWSVWGGQDNFYVEDIPAEEITNLTVAFLDFDENGNLKFADEDAMTGNPMGQEGVQWGAANAGILPAVEELKAQNPNLKTGISIGGWSLSGDFSVATHDEESRANLIEQIVDFMVYTNMDYIDVDWEYPGSVREADKVDNKNDEGTPNASEDDAYFYYLFLQELNDALDEAGEETGKDYEVSIAVPVSPAKLDNYEYSGNTYEWNGSGWTETDNYVEVTWEDILSEVDFVNLMTYDADGAFSSVSGHQSQLYDNSYADEQFSIDSTVEYMLDQGAEPEQLVIGSAYYTRGWESVDGDTGLDPNNPGLYSEAEQINQDADGTPTYGATNDVPLKLGDSGRQAGVYGFRNIEGQLKEDYPGVEYYWDEEAHAPYLYDDESGAFFTFDDVRSVTEKSEYILDNDLGGMVMWQAANDNPSESGSLKRDELTNAISDTLYGDDLVEHEVTYTDKDITADVNAKEHSWDDSKGVYEITINNNESLDETNQVLEEVEEMDETIKNPTVYINFKDGVTVPTTGDYRAPGIEVDGQTVIVNLHDAYEGKEIAPGESYTFELTSNSKADEDNIESITLTQFIADEDTEINEQVIYGEEDTETTPEVDTTAPEFTGVDDVEITQNTEFDPLAGVSATDDVDGNLNNSIEVTGNVDTSNVGTYNLTYSVTDSSGNTTTVERVVEVVRDTNVSGVMPEVDAVNNAPVISGVQDTEIHQGDEFDPLENISANDYEDGDLTSEIVVSGEVDTSTVGSYDLTYTVTDSDGNEVSVSRVVTVLEKEEEITPEVGGAEDEMVSQDGNVMVGYWHNFDSSTGYQGGSAVGMELDEVDEAYNVVDVAFMTAEGTGSIPTFTPDPAIYSSDEEFIEDVALLNSQGRSVILSMGGADAHIELYDGQQEDLANEIIRLVDYYGFDGIDVDLEQSAITAGDNATVIPEALVMVDEHYKALGQDFTITLAPEFPYLRSGGHYEEYLDGLEGHYDWVNPQYYNQGGDGISHPETGQWIAQNNDALKEDFLYYLSLAMVEGDGYVQIPSDKLVIGLPSNIDSAATGYVVDEEDVYNTFERMEENGTPLKGLMTWSVNWDEGQDKNGNSYDSEFARTYEDLIYGEGDTTTPVDPEDTTAPTDVTGLKADNITTNSADISYNNSIDETSSVSYDIYLKEEGLFSGYELIGNTTTTNYSVIGLEPNTEYSVAVVAKDAAGNETPKSEISFTTLEEQVDNIPPTQVQNIEVINITENGAVVNFDESYDNSGISYYEIYLSDDTLFGEDMKLIGTTTDTFYTLSNLEAGEEYTVGIKAVDNNSNKSIMSQVTFTTNEEEVEEIDETAPTKVSNLEVTNITDQSATVTYDESMDEESVVSYDIYLNGEFVANTYNTQYVLENLDSETDYEVAVVAKDMSNNKAEETTANFTTLNSEDGGEVIENGTWSADEVYLGGDQVTYDGHTYEAKWWTQGNVPSENSEGKGNDVWILLDPNTDTETGNEEWQSSKAYNGGDVVDHNGTAYEAKWWTQGDNPENSDVWVAQDSGDSTTDNSEWNSSSVYNTGDTVTYNGKEYTAKWWTQGDNPETSDVWEVN